VGSVSKTCALQGHVKNKFAKLKYEHWLTRWNYWHSMRFEPSAAAPR
jgi:hypothetical protein